MSIVVRYQPEGLTRAKYDEVSRRMESAGDWPPDGMDMHVLFGEDGNLRVSEIWDSMEQYEAFSQLILPVLDEVGVQHSAAPEIHRVHELEKRATAAH